MPQSLAKQFIKTNEVHSHNARQSLTGLRLLGMAD